eukprot:UN27459
MTQYKPEIIFHLASVTPGIRVPESLFYRVNVQGTSNLLQYCKNVGTKRFVYASSIGAVITTDYDTQKTVGTDTPYPEDGFLDCYGESKALCEYLITCADSDKTTELKAITIRFPGLMGPGDIDLIDAQLLGQYSCY